jgi:hypothetical protein
LEGLLGGKAGVGLDDHHPAPRGQFKMAQHLADQEVLMTFDCRINHPRRHRDAKGAPVSDQQQHRVTKQVRLEFPCLGSVSERLFLAGLLFARRIGNQMQDAIFGRRQSVQHLADHQLDQSLLVPGTSADHPQRCPVGQPRGHVACQSFDLPRRGDDQAHQQPAPDIKVFIMALER